MDLNVQRIEVLWLHRDTCAHGIITSKRSVIFTVMYLYYLWKKNSYGNVCTKGQSLEHNRIKMYLWGIRDTIICKDWRTMWQDLLLPDCIFQPGI